MILSRILVLHLSTKLNCATDQASMLLPDISARYAVTSSLYRLLFIIFFFSFIFFMLLQ
jgi:hypothetical protein